MCHIYVLFQGSVYQRDCRFANQRCTTSSFDKTVSFLNIDTVFQLVAVITVILKLCTTLFDTCFRDLTKNLISIIQDGAFRGTPNLQIL